MPKRTYYLAAKKILLTVQCRLVPVMAREGEATQVPQLMVDTEEGATMQVGICAHGNTILFA